MFVIEPIFLGIQMKPAEKGTHTSWYLQQDMAEIDLVNKYNSWRVI